MTAKKITSEAYNFNQKIGERIRLLRRLRKISLVDFGKALGVTLNQASLYELGKGDIKVSRLKEIAKVLGVSIYELFPEDEQADYQPISNECIVLLNYLISNKINIEKTYELIRDFNDEGLL